MLEDLKEKFQINLIYLFAPFTVVFVAPVALFRYLDGQYVTAALDAGIVLIVLCTVVFVYWRKSVKQAAIVAGVLYTTGAVLAPYVNSPFYIFWLYPAVLANFFLLHPVLALAINLVALAAVVPVALQTPDPILTSGMMGSLLFSISMSFGFSRLTEKQRMTLKTAASQDALTGVGNRRQMDVEIARSMDSSERHGSPMSLIILDLDKFKDINERYGRRLGDQLLKSVANLLTTQTRTTDRVFRYGGEEFVLLTEHTPADKAALIAENLRKLIAIRIKSPDEPLTASFGCAQLEPGESAEHWFGRADRALYRAKNEGRNRVVVADDSENGASTGHLAVAQASGPLK
jgi:diguanylate cyclase (GGDEF)-like protein